MKNKKEKGRFLKNFLLVMLASLLSGCCWNAYTNKPMSIDSAQKTHATFEITDERGAKDVLVALALSGGGSRAAYFSAAAMLKLQEILKDDNIDILKEVDIISCVSGGSLPGAYYCISQDVAQEKAESNRYWNETVVKDLMSRDYQSRWIANWFWPYNIVRYWLTAYDRSDIMAQTFEDNLFDVYPWGGELLFKDLNPERPYLIINATDGTENVEGEAHFGKSFTFTEEDFRKKLNSDINTYSIARAVMASCAFPGAFNYMTLKDHRTSDEERFLHVFDGGNSDNLGLESIKRLLLNIEPDKYKHYIVILIDSYKEPKGIDRNNCDPRSFFSYVIDMNFFDTFDSLLKESRNKLITQFNSHTLITDDNRKKKINNFIFWHITFEDIRPAIIDKEGKPKKPDGKQPKLRDALNAIPTQFWIDPKDTKRIDQAVDELIKKNNKRLEKIRKILLSNTRSR